MKDLRTRVSAKQSGVYKHPVPVPGKNYEGKIVLTNGFIKKTQKTPPEEIRLAKERRADFKERMGKA